MGRSGNFASGTKMLSKISDPHIFFDDVVGQRFLHRALHIASHAN